jgi:hypothetical protein
MAKEVEIDTQFILKTVLIIGLVYAFYSLYLHPIFYSPVPFGDIDAVCHTYSVKRTMELNGLISGDDYEILNSEEYMIQRPPGFHGVISGLLEAFYEFNYNSPRLIVSAFILLTGISLSLFYKKSYWPIMLTFSIINLRTYTGYINGQWPFMLTIPLIFLAIKGFEKKKLHASLTILTAFLIHPLSIMPIILWVISDSINKVINKKRVEIKYYLKTFIILLFCLIPFINNIVEIYNYWNPISGGFYETEYKIQNILRLEMEGYDDTYLNNHLNNYSLLLFLIPVSIYYSLKKKKYTLFFWFLLCNLCLILIPNQQLFRLLAVTPFITILFASESIKYLSKSENKLVLISSFLILLPIYLFIYQTSTQIGGLEVQNRIALEDYNFLINLSETYSGEVFTSNFEVNTIRAMIIPLLINNKYFPPIVLNGTDIVFEGYEDYTGSHNISKVLVLDQNNKLGVVSVE